MSDEPHQQDGESAAEDARLLDDTSRAELLELAKSDSEAQINRLQAVETKSGTLAVFAAVVAGLLIGQDAAGTGPLAWAAVGLLGATALVAAVTAGCTSQGFRWPDPKSTGISLEEHPPVRVEQSHLPVGVSAPR